MSLANSIDDLKSNNLFNGQDFSSLSFPYNPKNFMEIKEGNLIYKTGEFSNFVFLIVKGEVKLKNIDSKKLTVKSVNDYFGDFEIIEDSHRKSTAMANTDCIVYKLDSGVFKEIFNKSEYAISDIPANEINPAETVSEINDPILKNGEISIDNTKLEIENEIEAESVLNSFDTITDTVIAENIGMTDTIKPENLIYDIETINETDSTNELTDQYRNTNPANTQIIIEEEVKEYKPENELDNIDQTIIPDSQNIMPRENFISNGQNKYENQLQPSTDLKKTAKEILHFLLKQTDSVVGAFYIYNPEDNRLEDFYQTSESFYKTKKSLRNGITSLAAKDKKIRIVTYYTSDSNFNAEIDLPNDFTGDTIIFIPIVSSDNNLLAIVQTGSNQNDFTKDEEISIERAAKYCSTVFQQSLDVIQPLNKNQDSDSDSDLDSNSDPNPISDLSLIANFILQDVKAPLMNIKNYSAILSKFQLQDEVKKVIALISAQSTSIIDLIQSSIAYSENNNNFNFEKISFNDALNQILTLLSDYVESRNVKLFKKLSDDVNVNIDVHKLYAACYYISKFACDLMPGNGKLYFSSYIDNQNIILKIKDESKGITDAFINNIFENPIFETKEDVSVLGLKYCKIFSWSYEC